MPLITLFIPTYKRPRILEKAIQSAIDQTWKDLQIVVCDNASGDETPDIVTAFTKKDPRVHLISHPKNIGMMANYQFMLSNLITPFFSFLSDDDILLPHFFETAMEGFSQYPDIAFFAASTILLSKEKGIVRIPLDEWSREGYFLPQEGVCEMIGKYPVPMTVLFKKKAEIDLNNPVAWDCDFLIQLAAQYPFAISKKRCGVFLSHDGSFTTTQSHSATLQSIERMIVKTETRPQIDPKIRDLIKTHLKQNWCHFCTRSIISDLVQKKCSTARASAKKLRIEDSNSLKSLLLLSLAWSCSLFPFASPLLSLLKKCRDLIKRKKFSVQGLEEYKKWVMD